MRKPTAEERTAAVAHALDNYADPETGRIPVAVITRATTEMADVLGVSPGRARDYIPIEKRPTPREAMLYARSKRGSGPPPCRCKPEAPLIDANNGELKDYDLPAPESPPLITGNGRASKPCKVTLDDLKYDQIGDVLRAIRLLPHLAHDIAALRGSIEAARKEIDGLFRRLDEETQRRDAETRRWVEAMERHHNLIPVERAGELVTENELLNDENARLVAKLEGVKRALTVLLEKP